MKYFIGKNGEGLFLMGPVEGEMFATPALGASFASLEMKAIKEYLNSENAKGDPMASAVARQDYQRIKDDPRSMIGLDVLISSIRLVAGKDLPPSRISQSLIKEAHAYALQRFQLAGIPL